MPPPSFGANYIPYGDQQTWRVTGAYQDGKQDMYRGPLPREVRNDHLRLIVLSICTQPERLGLARVQLATVGLIMVDADLRVVDDAKTQLLDVKAQGRLLVYLGSRPAQRPLDADVRDVSPPDAHVDALEVIDISSAPGPPMVQRDEPAVPRQGADVRAGPLVHGNPIVVYAVSAANRTDIGVLIIREQPC